MMLIFFKALMVIISAVLATAFFTLLEHKTLGGGQMRKGPNKVSFIGILQPFADATKLLTKELFIPAKSNPSVFLLSPVLILLMVLSAWLMFPHPAGSFNLEMSLLFFLCCASVSAYLSLLSGWASYSKYSLLGSLRTVAQAISYEVVLALLLIALILSCSVLSSIEVMSSKAGKVLPFLFPVMILWLCACLAETNRTPFDFSEGESELVSGFNTEFSASPFVLIFLAEYSSILLLSVLTLILFFSISNSFFLMGVKVTLIAFLFIWVRSTLPRLRYDKLMKLAWKSLLPLIINMLLFMSSFTMLII